MKYQGTPLGEERGKLVAYVGNEPVLVVGATGSNKTVGPIACELVSEPGERSYFVFDPKLELAAICANYRRRVCGAENVKIINPYGVLLDKRPDLRSDKWNPVGGYDASTPALGDICASLGDGLVKADSNQLQKHFVDAARSAMTGEIKAEIIEASAAKLPASLPNVRAVLTSDAKKLQTIIRRQIAGGDFDITTRLSKFLAATDELENIKSNVESATAWMTADMCADMVTPAGVDLGALRQRPTSVFVGLPPDEVDNKAGYLRVLLSSLLKALYRHGPVPVTIIIEEAYVLGRHDDLLKALSILRGFDCRMICVFQSMQQIKSLYPNESELFTAAAVVAFRPSGQESADWMAKRAGETIVPVLSAAEPSNPSELRARPNWGPQKRERIPAGKAFAMPHGAALAWLPGDDAPRKLRVKGYFEIPELNARADPNPYYRGKAKPARNPRWWRAGLGWKAAGAVVVVAGVMTGGAALWWPGAASSPAAGGQSLAHPPSHVTMHRPALHAGNSSPRLRP
jgi:type IV secretory pathway TraG/TraD family ATPase VirD4